MTASPVLSSRQAAETMNRLVQGQLAPGATITITVGEAEPAEAATPVAWQAVLAVEGVVARDNGPLPRILPQETLTWGDLPVSLMVLTETPEGGHEGAELGGRIDSIVRIPRSDFSTPGFDVSEVPEDANIIFGTGVFDTGTVGENAVRLVRDKMLRGVSVDLVGAEFAIARADTLEVVDEAELTLEDIFSGDYVLALQKGEIGGATAAPMQALGAATIALVASAGFGHVESAFGIVLVEDAPDAVVAAAPMVRGKACYFRPEADKPTPFTILENGEVFGHFWLKGTCHTGFQHRCLMPEPSPTAYANFHLNPVPTEEGEDVLVGQITLNTDHAPVRPGVTAEEAWNHYSNTGWAVADVRLSDGRFGGWVSGALRAIPDKDARTLKAAKLSGDWRKINGLRDLIGLLAVNVPGFPVPHPEAWVVASAAGEEIEALVAAGIFPDIDEERATLLAELIGDEFEERAISVSFDTTADVDEMTQDDLIDLGQFVKRLAADMRLRAERMALEEALLAE